MDSLENNKLLERYKNARAVEASYLKDRSSLAVTGLANARDGAKQLVTAASAVATVYTAALGLVFGVKDNPLPERAIWAVFFFGLSIVLGTIYLAPTRLSPPTLSLNEHGGQTLPTLAGLSNNITVIANQMSAYNRRFVWGSLAALGVAVGAMAFPFLTLVPKPQPATAVPPPLPQQPLTGAAERAYEYQVTIYERALCNSDDASVVGTSRCSAVKNEGGGGFNNLIRIDVGDGTDGTTTTGEGWFGLSDNSIARWYAALGLFLVIQFIIIGGRPARSLKQEEDGRLVIGPLLMPPRMKAGVDQEIGVALKGESEGAKSHEKAFKNVADADPA